MDRYPYLGTLYYLIRRVHLRTKAFYLVFASHTSCFCVIKFLAPLPGTKFRVDIDNSAIRYYSGILFYFVYISACNLVFAFVHVITVKVIVNVCEDWVKLNYFRQRNLATMQNNEGQDQDQEQTSRKGVTMGIMVGIMRQAVYTAR